MHRLSDLRPQLSHKLANMIFSRKFDDIEAPERVFRIQGFGFPANEGLSGKLLVNAFCAKPVIPICICVSPTLFPRPDDWDESIQLCAPLVLPLSSTMDKRPPQPGLVKFMEGGVPPVYIGWGSMTCKSAMHMSELACRALYISKNRGVVLSGWADLGPKHLDRKRPDHDAIVKYAEENIWFGNDLPHEWLFSRCKLTVHHGGSGTTHAAVRAGVPTVRSLASHFAPHLALLQLHRAWSRRHQIAALLTLRIHVVR
jgi:hypothetical protein